jgi:ABC-type antimicrobial peptide transport system permease subunit
MITTKDSLNQGFEELGFGGWNEISERFWVDLNRNAIIHSDVTTIYETLDNVRRQFEQQALPFAHVSDYGIQEAVNQYSAWSMGMTSIAISFSVPSIIMGILLIYYNSNLLSDELRRDVGTIKTRGASGFQAFSWIISSAIVTGLLGCLGAVFMGVAAALLSSTVRTFFVFNLTQLFDLTLIMSYPALLSIFIFSFGVGLVVAFPIGVRAYLMTATEAHKILERESLLQQENLGNPLIEILVLGASSYVLLLLMGLIGWISLYGYASLSLMLFLVPVMVAFILSFARLLSRPIARYKSRIMSRFKRPSLLVGARVMSRTVLMYKKSEAMGVVFIAMVFTAGVFASTSATTGLNHTQSVFKFYTGADIAITVNDALTNVTMDMLENITAVEGVAEVCPILTFQGSISYFTTDWGYRYYVNESILVYAVDPQQWLDSAFWLPYFTLHGTPETAISQMVADNKTVLSSFRPVDHYTGSGFSQTPVYANEYDLSIYGAYWANASHSTHWVNETTVTIADVLGDSDSYGNKYLTGEPGESRFVVVDIDYAHLCLNTTRVEKFYVKMNPGANYTEVMESLWSVAPYSFSSISSPYPQIEEMFDSKAGQTIYGVYTLNVVFTLIYLSIGMVIVATVRVRRLRKQFSVLRALGTENKSIQNSVLIDTSIGLIAAAGIGAIIGLILATFAINMPLVYFGTSTIVMWLRLPVIIAIPPVILGIILGCSFLFALVATYYVTSKTLKKNIAEEMQYGE